MLLERKTKVSKPRHRLKGNRMMNRGETPIMGREAVKNLHPARINNLNGYTGVYWKHW
jgi:hypothetical protein